MYDTHVQCRYPVPNKVQSSSSIVLLSHLKELSTIFPGKSFHNLGRLRKGRKFPCVPSHKVIILQNNKWDNNFPSPVQSLTGIPSLYSFSQDNIPPATATDVIVCDSTERHGWNNFLYSGLLPCDVKWF